MESSEPLPGKRERSFLRPRVEILRLDFSRLGKNARPQSVEDRATEIGRVARHLLAIVREHCASARRVGSPLDREAVETVVEALRTESFGRDPRPLLRHPDPVAAWLREALFEDLLEVPGNVFFTTHLDEGTIRYEAMESSFWRECLRELAERLAEG